MAVNCSNRYRCLTSTTTLWRFRIPGSVKAEATRVLGTLLRDVMKLNLGKQNFRLFGPDETASNRLEAVYEVSGKEWMADVEAVDTDLSTDGRVMEMLSEHMCEGWLEGYLLTGRHGFFSCYEAFIHIIGSMFNQHAKWLKVCNGIPWRKPIASLELPADVACLAPGPQRFLASGSRLYRSRRKQEGGCGPHLSAAGRQLPVVGGGSLPAQPQLHQFDHRREAAGVAVARYRFGRSPLHRRRGHLAMGQHRAGEPDVVMACAGDVPTLETMAAVTLLREYVPDIRIRVVNVVDLMVLQPQSEHPHGMEDQDFDDLFTADKPVIFAFHGYPALIHKLTYRRHNHDNIHVRGFRDEGTTTTPFDMVVLNNLDRYQLALDAIRRIPRLADQVEKATARYWTSMERHKLYISEHGDDLPEVRDWRWSA